MFYSNITDPWKNRRPKIGNGETPRETWEIPKEIEETIGETWGNVSGDGETCWEFSLRGFAAE